jgi:hypothetical protein
MRLAVVYEDRPISLAAKFPTGYAPYNSSANVISAICTSPIQRLDG